MSDETYRTCSHCGTVNLNRDYCKNCGKIININLKRKLERERKAEEKSRTEIKNQKKKSKVTLFFERARENENIIIRYTARFFYSIWIVVLAIGSFLALVFGYIAA